LLLVAPRLVAVNGRAGVVALSAAAAAPGTRMAGKAALWGLVLGLAAWDVETWKSKWHRWHRWFV